MTTETIAPSLSRRTLTLLRTLAPHVGLSPQDITVHGVDGYVRFQHATHAYIRTSVPLMHEARKRFAELKQDRVVAYLDQHIVEEADHDLWTIEDLATNGLDTDTRAAELIPEIAAAPGAQYYHIRHGNPWLFFAYVYALETSPPTTRLIDDLRTATGLPDSAFRTLRAHQDLDVQHADDLAALIDTFVLTTEEQLAFQRNALVSLTQILFGVRQALAETA
jgi:pyrroloquinoline quinone (PQQ) biosynthesis protein C